MDDVMESCRLCLSKQNIYKNPIDSIFVESEAVSDLITKFCGINLAKNDNFTKKICDECLKCLININQLRKTAQQNDYYLRKNCTSEDDIEDANVKLEIEILSGVDSGGSNNIYIYDECVESDSCDQMANDTMFEIEEFKDQITDPDEDYYIEKETKPTLILKKQSNQKIKSETSFSCNFPISEGIICGNSFPNAKQLYQHKMKDHPNPTCFKCGKSFKNFKGLDTHLSSRICSIAKRENLYCSQCGMEFSSKAHLKNHEMKHTNPDRAKKPIKYFECDLCGKKVTQKKNIITHIKIVHLQLREFVCNLCGRGFTRNTGLRDHMLAVHSDPEKRPLQCPFCPKRFVNKTHREAHVRIHTGKI